MNKEYEEPELNIIDLLDVLTASEELKSSESVIYEGEEPDKWQ